MNLHKLRDVVEDNLRRNLLGPGSEDWSITDTEKKSDYEDEIISQKPLSRYFTGILFPQLMKDKTNIPLTENIFEDDGTHSDENKFDSQENMTYDYIPNEYEKLNNLIENGEDVTTDKVQLPTVYMPSSMGMTFAVPEGTDTIEISIKFGCYKWVPWNERCMPIRAEEEEILLRDTAFGDRPEFFNHIRVHDGYLFLDGKNGTSLPYNFQSAKDEKTIEEKENNPSYQLKKWKREVKKKNQNIIYDEITNRLARLIGRDLYKRIKNEYVITMPTENFKESRYFNDSTVKLDMISKNYEINKKLIRITLRNTNEIKSTNRHFSVGDPEVSSKSIYQTKISVSLQSDKKFIPYQRKSKSRDQEEAEIKIQFRNLQAYAVGHNTSVSWNKEHSIIETEWLPTTPVVPVITDIDSQNMSSILDLKNTMTSGNYNDDKLIEQMSTFVNNYKFWICKENTKFNELSNSEKITAERILTRQAQCLERLKEGVRTLMEDKKALECFRATMLAMRIQMILSRHPNFGSKKKTKENAEKDIPETSIKYFQDEIFKTILRPFQLAYILLGINGIVKPETEDRTKIVDLIWFPTGGGKTEAYLGLTAFCILWRRCKGTENSYGTTVIMRYTLRLLTAQQFERASRLICALEFMRNTKDFSSLLGEKTITIGLYVGKSSTPNNISEADKIANEVSQQGSHRNQFQIHHCPWCGCETDKQSDSSFKVKKNQLLITCRNKKCLFNFNSDAETLPILLVDEQIYNDPPTLLFGTVDKFAQIIHKEEAYKIFGRGKANNLPPDLIIQDELHLISGPLGSSVGLFETIFEELCKREDGTPPKIIASTATTRNTDTLIKAIYGNDREARIFPPAGIDEDDSYFAKKDPSRSNLRKYFGVLPTGRTSSSLHSAIIGQLIAARIDILRESFINQQSVTTDAKINSIDGLDKFWTILSYYNSLREVGIAETKISEEIKRIINGIYERAPLHKKQYKTLGIDFFKSTLNGFNIRNKELTSRIASKDVKATMDSLENTLNTRYNDCEWGDSNFKVNNVIDIALATNMISVGLDVSRLNLMVINGQPRSVSEYIQASSRVARSSPGLVLVINSPYKVRERSLYEHFYDFHQAMYKHVEPLSATPATEAMFDQLLPSLLIALYRNRDTERHGKKKADDFPSETSNVLIELLTKRFNLNQTQLEYCNQKIANMKTYWSEMHKHNPNIELSCLDSGLLKAATRTKNVGDEDREEVNPLTVVQSLRNVSPQAYIKLKSNSRNQSDNYTNHFNYQSQNSNE